MLKTLFIAALTISLVFSKQPIQEHTDPKRHPHRSRSCPRRRSHASSFDYTPVKLHPNKGFYAFSFGKAGVSVPNAFYFHYGMDTVLNVFDCYCTGDALETYDYGRFLGNTAGPYDGNSECVLYSDSANFCLQNVGWSTFTTKLYPGNHNLTFVPLYSPYQKGTGFVSVSDLCSSPNPPGYVRCCESNFSCNTRVVN